MRPVRVVQIISGVVRNRVRVVVEGDAKISGKAAGAYSVYEERLTNASRVARTEVADTPPGCRRTPESTERKLTSST